MIIVQLGPRRNDDDALKKLFLIHWCPLKAFRFEILTFRISNKMDFKTFFRCFSLCISVTCLTLLGVVSASHDESAKLVDWRNLDRPSTTTLRNLSSASTSMSSSTSMSMSRSLSRKRRFIYPAVTPWLFDVRLTMDIPLQGLDTAMRAYIPFTWNLNTLV